MSTHTAEQLPAEKPVIRQYRVTITREYVSECVSPEHARDDALEQDEHFKSSPVVEVEEVGS